MAGKVKHIVHRDGRYYARVVVPPELRRIIGKTELREPLGADKRTADRNLHATVARLLDQIEQARRQLAAEAPPLAKIARDFYARELERDDDIRAMNGERTIKSYNATFRDSLATSLRRLAAGRLEKDEEEALLGWAADEIASRGEARAAPGTQERRDLLRALASVKLEVLARSEERDRGQITPGAPVHPLLVDKPPVLQPVTLGDYGRSRVMNEHSTKTLAELLPMFREERKVGEITFNEQPVAIRMIEEFFREPKPVCEITRNDLQDYKRALVRTPNRYAMRFPGLTLPEAVEANAKRAEPFATLNPNTINDKWLAHIRAILNWCVDSGIIPDNPASNVRVGGGNSDGEPTRLPFSPGDLAKLFGPPLFAPGVPFETRHWALLLALFTGARSSSEIARIGLDDIYREQGVLVFHLAHASKNKRSKRLVPVHKRLIALGLEDYINTLRARGETKLFPDWEPEDKINRWFLRTYRKQHGINDPLKVFHSFRHTFKTAVARLGISKDLNDLITGHEDQTVSGVYIHDRAVNMVQAMAEAVNRLEFDGIDWKAMEQR